MLGRPPNYPRVVDASARAAIAYPRFVRYDLSKLRAKHSRRYRLFLNGYSICLVFLKLFERVYAQAAAGFLSPIKAHASLHSQQRSQLDRLYQRAVDELDKLIEASSSKPYDRRPKQRNPR